MPFHLVGYHSNQAENGAYTNVSPILDPTVTISGNYIYIPELNNIIGVVVFGGPLANGCYIQTPSLRKLLNLDIAKLNLSTYPLGSPIVELFPEDPIALERYEGMEVLLNTGASTAERHTVLVFLSDGALAKVSGDIRTVRATASINAVEGEWTEGVLTFRQTLPVGTYAVVGAVGYGENMVAFRFIPVGYAWRPGGVASPNLSMVAPEKQRKGGLGIWFTFDARTPPAVEILAVGSCTSQVFYLDLMKVA